MTNRELRFLVIDDDPGDIALLRRYLADITEAKVEVTAFTAPEAALALLPSLEVDLIFVDYLMGDRTGLDVFHAIRNVGCDRPVVMLTGHGSESVAVEAMKAGVADYVVKGTMDPPSLRRVMVNALAKYDLETKLREKQSQLADKVRELEEALAHVKTLRGIVPICAHCKKIRDDEGYWHQVEVYVRDHTEAEFSHGLCEACISKLYPDLAGGAAGDPDRQTGAGQGCTASIAPAKRLDGDARAQKRVAKEAPR